MMDMVEIVGVFMLSDYQGVRVVHRVNHYA